MKSKKVLALIILLVGIVACVVAVQRFIIYSDASDSARNSGSEADRASGQKRMDMEREGDRRSDSAKKLQIQAVLSGLIGVGLIVTSIVLLAQRKANSNGNMN